MRLLDRSKHKIRTAWSIFKNLYYHGKDEQKISKTLKTVQYDCMILISFRQDITEKRKQRLMTKKTEKHF